MTTATAADREFAAFERLGWRLAADLPPYARPADEPPTYDSPEIVEQREQADRRRCGFCGGTLKPDSDLPSEQVGEFYDETQPELPAVYGHQSCGDAAGLSVA